VLGQRHRQRWRFGQGLPASFQRQAHGIRMRHATRQGVVNRRRQFGHAVTFQQVGQRPYRSPQRLAAFDGLVSSSRLAGTA
jgi:anti-sigma factor RsiW